MKKLFLTICLLAAVAVANAQFVVSVQMGGYRAVTGATTTLLPTYDTAGVPLPIFDTLNTLPVNNTSATLGVKFGYQLGRVQFGISGSFTEYFSNGEQTPQMYQADNPNSVLMPVETYIQRDDGIRNTIQYADYVDDYMGQFNERFNSFTIAPYLRCELVQVGDVAFFAELSGFFTKVNKPFHHDYLDWYAFEMHNTIDTSYTINRSSVSYGAAITPGMSWQLTPYCCLDLYFDLLSIAYRKSTLTEVTVEDLYNYADRDRFLARRTETTQITETTSLGYYAAGIQSFTDSYRNLVRVGLSFTF